MNHSETINELATALATAQGEIAGAVKGSTNPAFRSKYADLSSVWEAIRAPLSKHGLSVIQEVVTCDAGVGCRSLLMHKSGQWIATESPVIPCDKNNAHGHGSAATYARRFSLVALIGVPQIDDDGNAAVESKPEPKRDPEALAAAKKVADGGTESFRLWWAKTSQANRASLREHISELQAIAKTADAEHNQAQARQNDDPR